MQKPIKYLDLLVVLLVSIAVGVACKLGWPDSSGWPEVFAFVLAAVAVYFQTVQHILAFPSWIVCVSIYAYVFHQGQLYADRDLQFLYVILSIHGWISWHKPKTKPELKVSRLKPLLWIPVLGIIALGTALYYPSLVAREDPAPFWDGFLTVSSVVAQFLLNRKIYENWAMWVLINGAYIPLYIDRGYRATAIIYGVFWILAVIGWIQWRKDLASKDCPVLDPQSSYPR